MSGSVELTPRHRDALLSLAEVTIATALTLGEVWLPDLRAISDSTLRRPAATFVTLTRDARLLGCIGTTEATRPLALAVAQYALAAAFADPRMPPIDHDDFIEMSVSVSVLSEPVEVPAQSFLEVADAVRPGIDGLVLRAPGHHATLLPSVWHQLPDVHGFLEALWQKAGLPAGSWSPGTRVLRYITEEFTSPGPRPPARFARSARGLTLQSA
jgi:AmmeMemoRadiSam system protein A